MPDAPKDEWLSRTRIDLRRPAQASPALPMTSWTLVGRAGAVVSRDSRAAIEELLRLYIPALRAHLGSKMAPDRVDDVVQAFIAEKVLEKQMLSAADRNRGRFRTFLLTALDRFVIDSARVAGAAKRSPGASGRRVMDIDDPATPQPAARDGDPTTEFDRAWARQAVTQATQRMQDECTLTGRSDLWGVFRDRLLLPAMEGAAPVPHEELAKRYGFETATQASNALGTAKRLFARHFQAVVAAYAADPAEVNQEIRELWGIFSRRNP